jgi:hypothetical protein
MATQAHVSTRTLAPINTRTRINLTGQEVCRLPNMPMRIRIVQGIAWITSQQQDILARSGDTLDIPQQTHPVIISAANGAPMVCDIDFE